MLSGFGVPTLVAAMPAADGSDVQTETADEPVSEKSEQADAGELDPSLPQEAEQGTWIDQSQRYVDSSTDALAGWLDNFFGSPRSDIESANSSLRLTMEKRWEEDTNGSSDIRLRGKVRLPRINNRLSLVFDDEDTVGPKGNKRTRSLDETNNNVDAGLQLNVREQKRSRLDLKLGLRSSGKLKANARYRYELPWSDTVTNRYTQRLYFVDGEGFGAQSIVEHDRTLEKNRLLRWSNSATFEEDSNGVEWSSQVNLARPLSNDAALTHYVWVSGITRPEYLTASYGVGSRYRKSFYRSWLFYELEPAYAWQRGEVAVNRDSGWLFTVRLEVLFERDESNRN